MKTIALALAALAGSATAAQAQLGPGQGVPQSFHGGWAINARACTRHDELDRGRIEVNEDSVEGNGLDERNAYILSFGGERGGRRTYNMRFTAMTDRQWSGSMTIRMVGNRLGLTYNRNRERLYVRCGHRFGLSAPSEGGVGDR
jgi:hypothetical protein